MEKMPEVKNLQDGGKYWEHQFEQFLAMVYIPRCDEICDIINFGFRAPYLLVFEETKKTVEEAVTFAKETGLEQIAAENGSSVVFIYPVCEGGWNAAPESLFTSIISESKINQYYQDGVARLRNRFTGNFEGNFIRGAIFRTCLYGYGESADYIARYCLQRIEGDGLWGRSDVSPAVCILQNLNNVPEPKVRDIPVVSVMNRPEVNDVLKKNCDYYLEKDSVDYQKDFKSFIKPFRRMVGHLEREADLEAMGMTVESAYVTVTTTPDNCGDDRDSVEHKIGYVAFYKKELLQKGPLPLLMCFHGGGDSAMSMASLSGWSLVAEKYGFLLVCVENHLNSTATETIEMIKQLKKKYPVDSTRIYASGFSMGGCKSWDMYQEYPQYFAALAPMDATFDVGQNSYGKEVGTINQDIIVPVFYAGGEITPLPELPFQAQKCTDRIAYVMRINQIKKEYKAAFDQQETWENPIWGINGDCEYKLVNEERENSVLNLQLFESQNGCCYCVLACVGNQGHEVRHHTCENAWKFLSSFRRLPDGSLEGGSMEKIRQLYK